jgi:hypothetical protein
MEKTVRLLRAIVVANVPGRLHERCVNHLGVLNVMSKLQNEGVNAVLTSGGGIQCTDCATITVRASMPRNGDTWSGGIRYWGWDLRRIWQKNFPYTHVVCVQFDAKAKVLGYYVIHQKSIGLFPKSPRYGSGIRTLVLPQGKPVNKVFSGFLRLAKSQTTQVLPSGSLVNAILC